MTIRHFILTSSFALLAAVNACQSKTSDDTPSSGAAGTGGHAAMAGASGQGTAGRSAIAGAAGNSSGGTANAGTGGEVGGTHAGGGGSGGANGGATNGGNNGTAGGAGASAGNSGTANGGSAGASGGSAGSSGTANGGGAGTGGQGQRQFAYFTELFSGIVVCSVDPVDGKPTRLQTAAIGNKNAINLVTDPSQRFVFVAANTSTPPGSVLETYRIGADGNLPNTPTSSIQNPDGSLSINIEPKGHFLYAAGNGTILTFKIDATTGALSATGTPVTAGTGHPTFIAIDPTGTFLYISMSFPEFGVRGYRIDPTSGALNELSASPFGATGLPTGDQIVTGAIVIKPSGDFLYTGGAFLNTGGALNAFAIEKSSGNLTLVDGSPFSLDLDADDYNTNMAMDPLGDYLYVTSAFQRSHVSGFKIDPTSGKLAQVPNSPLTISSPYAIAIDRSGRFVYVASDAPETHVFAIQRSDGKLIKHPDSPFQFGGLQPEISFATPP